MSVLGNAVVRLEAPRFVAGGGRFVDDIPVEAERVWRAIAAVGADLATTPTKGP